MMGLPAYALAARAASWGMPYEPLLNATTIAERRVHAAILRRGIELREQAEEALVPRF